MFLSHIIDTTSESKQMGIKFSKPEFNFKRINEWKTEIINNLSNGIFSLATKRKVKIINGYAKFISANKLIVTDKQKKQLIIEFNKCIIATGSSPIMLKHLYDDSTNIISSTQALNIKKIPRIDY